MSNPLITYLRDHLAGANFALELLGDLQSQQINSRAAEVAQELLPEIGEDRAQLESIVEELGADKSLMKDAAGWLAQKASRFKLRLQEPIGIFEAVELLSLGVLGKRALWRALLNLDAVQISLSREQLESLIFRAEQQHARLEELRLSLAQTAFAANSAAVDD